jgi:hypothetical protein
MVQKIEAKQLFKRKSILFGLFITSILCIGTAEADQEMICDPLPQEIWAREKGELRASKHSVPPDVYITIKKAVAVNKDASFMLSATPESDQKSPGEYVYVRDVINNPVIKIMRGNNGITYTTFAGTIRFSSIVEDEVISISGIQVTPERGSTSNWYFRTSKEYGDLHEAFGYLKNNHRVSTGSYYICGEWVECAKSCSIS